MADSTLRGLGQLLPVSLDHPLLKALAGRARVEEGDEAGLVRRDVVIIREAPNDFDALLLSQRVGIYFVCIRIRTIYYNML